METLEVLKRRIMVASKAIPNTTAAGVQTVEITLDDNYDFCEGIGFSEDGGAGLGSKYTIAIQNSNGSIMEATPAGLLGVGKADGSGVNERFLNLQFPIKGASKVTITITTGAAATADTVVYIAFKIVRTAKAVSV